MKRKQTKRKTISKPTKEAKMNLDSLTIGEVKQLLTLVGAGAKPVTECAYQVGEKYFIRTVTHYYTGRCTRVTDGELVLAEAAWIADTGRFGEFLKTGSPSEVEPYPDACPVIVPRGGIIDVSVWPHNLPRVAK